MVVVRSTGFIAKNVVSPNLNFIRTVVMSGTTRPAWLDETFLASCLQKDNPASGKVTVNSLNVQPAVAGNNNYSHILRASFQYRTERETGTKSTSLIVKAPKVTKTTEILEPAYKGAEVKFYNAYIPKFQEINQMKIAPKSYPSPKEDVVVLEDLLESGFTAVNNKQQLDFEHCKLYLMASAKMHATGIALKNLYPDMYNTFPCGRTNLKNEDYGKEIVHAEFIGLHCLVRMIKEMGFDDYKSYAAIIEKVTDKDLLRQGNLISVSKDHVRSFIHGDCLSTNMLFKHGISGKPTDIRLVDFELFNYDAVACDVISFIWSSANNEVQEHRLEDLYKIYCDTLNSTLRQLKCTETLSYEQLKKEILDNSLYTLVMIGSFLPLNLSEQTPDESIVFSGNSTVDQIMGFYQGKDFFKKYPHILKFADKQGLFEWLKATYV